MTKNLLNMLILWLLCATLLVFCFAVAASAQSEEGEQTKTPVRPVHIGFIYPLSTNGLEASECVNAFSLHALAGVSRGEQAFCLSGIAGIVTEKAEGVMIAGVTNVVRGDVTGVQVAGIANIAGSATVQVAGLANVVRDDGEMQLAGFANISKNAGCQVAGFINTAADAQSQVAGFINIARSVKGVQVAGLINIAEESNYPVGLINIIRKGEKQIGLGIDETGTLMATFRSGGKVLYGVVGAGINAEHEHARYALEGGLGAHIPLGRIFRVNIEAASTVWSDMSEEVYFRSSLRALAALKVTRDIALFAGPTFNHLHYDGGQKDRLVRNFIWDRRRYDNFNGLYIGFSGGIQMSL